MIEILVRKTFNLFDIKIDLEPPKFSARAQKLWTIDIL